ncbi:hypothetical protein ACRALDRAFT_1083829 [Sodiomyces alcalophilus JCM 7366]|uniref:uncharacterized protein n=1 Tax=Sodiomyces alcalophilus JCM 7366 TaxID=591952 RepID=UPI0039B6C3CF
MTDPLPPHSTVRVAHMIRPFERPVNYLVRAGRAASYPFRGIWYFLRNTEFYPLLRGRLIPLTIISILVYVILFTFTFLPQLALLAIFQGRSAWLNATILVLGEGHILIQALFEGFFVDEARVDVFDATLIKCSHTDLVSPHRILYPDAPTAVKMLGKPTSSAVYTPWSVIQIVEMIFFLPLNFIPIVGAPAFIMITGTRLGKLAHHRWWTLRGLDKKERKREASARLWEYVWFGTVAMIMQLIPVFAFFFLFTTTAGAALWAARLEDERRWNDVQAMDNEGGPTDTHPPPPYEDDPLDATFPSLRERKQYTRPESLLTARVDIEVRHGLPYQREDAQVAIKRVSSSRYGAHIRFRNKIPEGDDGSLPGIRLTRATKRRSLSAENRIARRMYTLRTNIG